jgi:tRNA1(Val) A37 N6-methylase TrmN6
MQALTDDSLLGGRVIYRQPVDGYRTGIEPMLLAASIPARAGDHVLEAGTGAGAGLLALYARVPGLSCTGLERDHAMVEIAGANATANKFSGIRVVRQEVEGWVPDRVYDHAFANPPWHRSDGTAPQHPGRRGAKMAHADLLEVWVPRLARALRRRGTLTLILPAGSLSQAIAALADANCREIHLLPLWPRAGEAAKLIILRGVREGRGACHVLPGLALHAPEGGYTEAAEKILRGGAALEF